MNLLRTIREVLTPGRPEFKAHLLAMRDEEARLIKCLHLVDNRVTQSVNTATDRAAEF